MKWLGISLALVAAGPFGAAGCYSTGDGTSPPPKQLYFPVGLGVSRGGNVLYVANSDFDLQYNGGTVQSYDLHLIRKHAVLTINNPNDPSLPLVRPPTGVDCSSSTQSPPEYKTDNSGQHQPLGETCAPPVDASVYVRDSAIIGAFATDLQLAAPRPSCVKDGAPQAGPLCNDLTCATGTHCERAAGFDRLFVPVRGDASLTWAQIVPDDPDVAPPENDASSYPPFTIDCGPRTNGRCDAAHHAGTNPNEPRNTRRITMPGEPFGMAQTEDGAAIAITHQTDTKTSLFSTGLAGTDAPQPPSLQFVLDGLAPGGTGITPVPHDPLAFAPGQMPRPAFLETSNASADVALLRYYADEGDGTQSSLLRPFLVKEAVFTITANAGGTDNRDIVIDPTPRIACEATATDAAAKQTCARLPARVFIANRAPASVVLGEIGEPSASGDGTYDPDRLVLFGNVPLSLGPSRVYLAPIVDVDGTYALRLFIVCFDSASIYVYDPEAGQVENIIRVGPGPFAMAFDPFDMNDVALHKKVPADPRQPGLDLKRYRFAYIASFTNSYVQAVDLDNSLERKNTFETVVYTLGLPTLPKGSQ